MHVDTRTDLLADELGELLHEPVGGVLSRELVVVAAKGVERWLTQRLSHRLGADEHGNGVCAGVDFVRPASLIGLLTDTDDADPWDPERLVWRVLSVVDASLDEPWCDPLARHLGKGHEGDAYELRQERRWTVARRIAGLFAGYARDRPRMLEDWATGGDGDGAGGHVDPDLTWQPELWRRVAAEIDAPTPVQRHRATVAAIRAGAPLALPDRLSLFGYTRLAVTELELVAAVAEVREVHLWLPVPSPAGWDVVGRRPSPMDRSSDATTTRSRPSVTRSPPRSAGTSARCNARCRSSRARLRRNETHAQQRARTLFSAGSSTTSGPTPCRTATPGLPAT